jgi:Domain of Unknown Function (DUF1543)
MMQPPLKLFMVLMGANVPGRNVELHDYFFGIAPTLKDLLPNIKAAWPEAGTSLHLDGWREINTVDSYRVSVALKNDTAVRGTERLFFINLGGYLQGKLEEQHYTLLTVQDDKKPAAKEAMKTLFYDQNSFKGAHSHIDERFGVDVDDMYRVDDILPTADKEQYHILIEPAEGLAEDTIHLGYFKLDKIV